MATTQSTAPIGELGHELGSAGATSGFPWDPSEISSQLTWPLSVAVFDKMIRQDSKVKSVYNAVTLPIRRAVWRLDPGDAPDEATRMIAQDLGIPILNDKTPISQLRKRQSFDFVDHVREACLNLVYGHMIFEKDGVIRDDGLWHLTKLGVRMPPTIAKIITARNGDLTRVEQYPSGLPGDTTFIKMETPRLVFYSHERIGGLWQGQSMLRSAYRSFLMKDRLLRVDAFKQERNGMGFPWVESPPGATDQQIIDMGNIASKLRAGENVGGALPAGAKLHFEGVTGTLPDTLASIKYHDQAIGAEALAQFLELITSTHGSRALASSFIDFFIMSVQAAADEMADTMNEQLIEPWVDWNWGEDVAAPRVVCGEIGDDHGITAEALASLVQSGALEPSSSLDAWLRENYRMPERAADEPWSPPQRTPVSPTATAASRAPFVYPASPRGTSSPRLDGQDATT